MSPSPLPDYRDPCGWNALLPAREPRAPARGAMRVKYAGVGAGYTGLAAARRLAELDPGAEIVVLEGTEVGEGSSARALPASVAAAGSPSTAITETRARPVRKVEPRPICRNGRRFGPRELVALSNIFLQPHS